MYGVVWKYTPENGEAQRLMSHPESLEGMDTVQDAKDEGNRIIADLKAENIELMPLSIVEINDGMVDTLNECPLVEIGDDMMFINVDEAGLFQNNAWWSK